MAVFSVEPAPPDKLGGLGSLVSPSEERSPDTVSSASEATEAGQSSHFPLISVYQDYILLSSM